MTIERHVMLDIETLSTQPHAHITEIAYAEFDPYSDEIGEIRHYIPSYDGVHGSAMGHISPDTVRWHLERGHKMPEATPIKNPNQICDIFAREMSARPSGAPSNDRTPQRPAATCWSKSPSFDEVIFREFFRRCGLIDWWPIHYRRSRDVRTICALAGIDVSKETTHKHIVSNDIINQVKAVQMAHRILKIAGPVEAAIDAFTDTE